MQLLGKWEKQETSGNVKTACILPKTRQGYGSTSSRNMSNPKDTIVEFVSSSVHQNMLFIYIRADTTNHINCAYCM